VVTGRAGLVKRRILVALDLAVDASTLVPTALFKQQGWVECRVEPTGSAPDSGCPPLPPHDL
jgi:hypothetical protein